ncbi:hypothetical protein HK098_002665 [Nowakowskiella sp. JEL0407]|nr:hypothetical protein HK098_002665 [Nowakowskiella sp. JEL0407]
MWLLKNDIANLHFTRHNYQLASSTWSNMVFKYSAIGWTCIDAKIIQKLATCFKSSNEIEKYIQSLVFLVSSACAESDTQGGLFEERIVRGWVLELNSVLPNMSEPMDTNAVPIFKTNVLSLINKLGDDDGLLLEVEVWSKLPEKFFVDEISVLLDGGIQSEMTFQIFKVELNPGSNILRMVCDSSSMPGTYAPKSTQIKISKLNFHCEFEEFENVVTDQGISAAVDTTVGVLGNSPEFGTNAKSFKKKNGKFLVKRITNSILVDVGVPDIVSYKNPKNCIRFRINSCASTMKSSSMNVTSVNGELQMKEVASVEFTISNNNGHEQTVTKRKLETIDGNIMLPDVSKQSIIEFDLEYLPNFGEKFWNQHELKIVISYTTDNEKRKLFLSTEKLKLNIPFNVSHDVKFLKDGRAILQFNVIGVDDIPLRFNSNSLDSENLNVEEITGCDNVQTIFRNQNHSYLYFFDVDGFKRNEKLKFSVNYHSVYKEIESFIQSELTRTLSKFSKEKYAGFLRYFIRNHVLTNLDYLDYAVFEEFSIFSILFKTTSLKGSTDDEENGVDVNLNVLKNELESEDELVCAELAELMEQFFKQLQKIPKTVIQESLKVRNYTVDYEFSIPFNKVILLCEYVLDETSKSCKLGELINVDIIVSIQEWQIADIQLLDCVLEIEIDNNHWMISGRRKELLKLQKNNHHNKSIILAPLQPGLLPLPKITINTIPQPIESTADLSTHENQPYQIDTILPNSGTQILVLPQSESHKIFIPDPTPQSRRPSAFGGPIPPSKEQQQLKQFMYPMRTSLPPGLNNRVSMIRSSSSPVSNLGKAVVGGKN